MSMCQRTLRVICLLLLSFLGVVTVTTAAQHRVQILTMHSRWPDPEGECDPDALVKPALPTVMVQISKNGVPVALVRTARGRDPALDTHLAYAYVTLEPGSYNVRAWDMTGASEVFAASVQGRNSQHPGSMTPPYGDFRLFVHDDSASPAEDWDFRVSIGLCPGGPVLGGTGPTVTSITAPPVWIDGETVEVQIAFADPDADIVRIQFLEADPMAPGTLRIFADYDPGVGNATSGIIYRNTGCSGISWPPGTESGTVGFLVRLIDSNGNEGVSAFHYVCTKVPATIDPPAGGYTMQGQWDTDMGFLDASQIGDIVTGSFVFGADPARIDGKLDGQTVYGTWSKSPTYAPPDDAGDLCLGFSHDGKEFMAAYRHGFSGDTWYEWNGQKSFFKVADFVPGSPVLIRFDSVVDHVYSAEHIDDLAVNPQLWVEFTNNVHGTGGPIEVFDTSDATNRYYRVRELALP